jgi:hypothetical protein
MAQPTRRFPLIRGLAGSALVLLGIASYTAPAQTLVVNGISLTTQDRKDDPGWWPTKGDALRSQYVGSETCASCHGRIAALQQTTPMFHAGARATDAPIPRHNRDSHFANPHSVGL